MKRAEQHAARGGKIEQPYGLWRSPLDLRELFAQPSVPMFPFRHGGVLHWLESLPEEGGRSALMRRQAERGRRCLTPPGFDIRSGVHEYGGRCFCVLGGEVVFNNFRDGRLYRQPLDGGGAPVAVTAAGAAGEGSAAVVGFADLVPAPRLGGVVAVMETRGEDGGGGRDWLVLVRVGGGGGGLGGGNGGGGGGELAAPLVLAAGADFYACPVLSPDQHHLAWLEWDDPFMPWDCSRLALAEFTAAAFAVAPAAAAPIAMGKAAAATAAAAKLLHKPRLLVAQPDQAVCQPGFLPDGGLLYLRDGADADFWDFFHFDGTQTRRITHDHLDYGDAHWVFGERRWRAWGDGIAAIAGDGGIDRVVSIALPADPASPAATPLAEFAVASHLRTAGNELLFIARHRSRGAEIRSLFANHHPTPTTPAPPTPPTPPPPPPPPTPTKPGFSRPQALTYPTADGNHAHAWLYAPNSRQYRAPPGSRPPLLVVVHGGPTSRATPELHPLKQYFTSLGYAILDVNHRGSTGYGRAYRQALLGQWGELDAADIADGVRHVTARGLADPNLVFIRGGSAGGYAVLRALTRHPRLFCGGACYYGIGNLITLAELTHKFEGCYTERLIGEAYDPATANRADSRYVQRSPVFEMAQLACPLILFQGLEDKIVPPAVSREVAGLLDKKGIAHQYIEYPNEGHGFRQMHTRIDSLRRETEFFADIIRARRA